MTARELRERENIVRAIQERDELVAKIKKGNPDGLSSPQQRIIDKANWKVGKEYVNNLFPKDDAGSINRKELQAAFDGIKHGAAKSQGDAKDAADLMGRVVDNLPYKMQRNVFVVEERPGRSEYDTATNKLFLGTLDTTHKNRQDVFLSVVHEISHWIEENCSEIKLKLLALYDRITYGEPIPISKKEGDTGTKVEFYRKSRIPLPLEYCTRDYVEEKRRQFLDEGANPEWVEKYIEQYKKNRPIELLSMFFEQLVNNPMSMDSEFGEYLDEIMRVLR